MTNQTNITVDDPMIDEKRVHIKGKTKKDTEHNLKILVNRLVKSCKEEQIPMFIAFYSEKDGYQYNGVMPEDVGVSSEYGRFIQFLRTAVAFNKEDYIPTINKKDNV